MKLILSLALTAGAFAQVHQTSAGPCSVNIANVKEAVVTGDCSKELPGANVYIVKDTNKDKKPSLSESQKVALMTAKADQLQADNELLQMMNAAAQLPGAKEKATAAQQALEKLIADTLKGIGCDGGQLVRKKDSSDIEVSCPEKVPAVPAVSK